MSTISNAAQIMVDKLVADLNSETSLSAEDQLLVAKALDTMKNSTTFETALIAVVEEHFNTADAALTAAKNDINAAKASIETQSTNLNLIPGLQTSIDTSISGMNTSLDTSLATISPTVRDNISGTFNNFQIGYNCFDKSLLQSINASSTYNRRPVNVASLDNYATGEFYAFISFGSITNAYRPNQIVRVKKDQSVQVATMNAQFFTTGTFGFCPFADDTSRLCRYDASTLYIQTIGAFTWEFSKAVDYQEIYYDKATKDLYVVSGGFLNKINTDGFVVEAEITFINQEAFTAWAQAEGHLRTDAFATMVNTSANAGAISYASNGYYNVSTVASYIGGSNSGYTSFTGFDLVSGVKRLVQQPGHNFVFGDIALTAYNTTTTKPMVTSLRGQASFIDMYGNYARLSIEQFTNSNLYRNGQVIYGPSFPAYSHIHKCLISSVAGQDYYSSTSSTEYVHSSLAFGR
ncbi:hypothetical protein [Thalassomonas haliotis]|uniref:Tail fiber protein n=1 Tax=Thalassomonas haliotis TaxID=485448 RepID=A0ABY7VBX2_9GAMM|nr:hypothetical protein [Thalassomonas haliotis]WDE11150.1 hypothetical protein H3N35_23405 [Thalassomonas haliotis]